MYLGVSISRLTDNEYNLNKVNHNKNIVQKPGELELSTSDL